MVALIKIRAFSIVESAIAISVIAACLGVGSVVFSNVIRSSTDFEQLHLENSMDSLILITTENEAYISEKFDTPHGTIHRKVNFDVNKNLINLVFTAKGNSGKSFDKKILISNP